jgi:hypothetical protein
LISCLHVVVFLLKQIGIKKAKEVYTQFTYNAYIRLYMLVYFDTTFLAVMKIFEGNNSTSGRKVALIISYFVLMINLVLPIILVALVFKRFEILKIKEAKQSFNTMIVRIDKNAKIRLIVPAYFFFRRLITACLLTLPIDNTFIFLQYVFILMSSHTFVLYLVAIKPYQTVGINWYVLANETFYSTLIIAMFIFSDATPELTIKFGAAIALITSLVLIVVSNMLMNIIYIIRGKSKLKKDIYREKKKRAENEALERAEDEDRKLRRKREEEEFMRLPDETLTGQTVIDTTEMTNYKNFSTEQKLKGNKNTDDVFTPQENDDDEPKSRYRKKKGDMADEVTDGTLEAKQKRKRRKHHRKEN